MRLERKKKKKKGILFTFLTVLMLSSLFFLTQVYLYRNKELQKVITLSATGDKFRYIEDDVISNIYSDLLWLNSSIIRDDYVKLIFSPGGKLGPKINHTKKYYDYENFVENTYANMHKLNISVNNFNPEFQIEPYGITFNYNSEQLYVYTDPQHLEKIILQLTADVSTLQSNTTPTNDNHEYPEIHVKFVDTNGDVLYEGNPQQDPDERGDFELIFDSGERVAVSFGVIGESPPGTLLVEGNFSVTLDTLELWFDKISTEVLITTDANILIKTKVEDINKDTEIVLLEE